MTMREEKLLKMFESISESMDVNDSLDEIAQLIASLIELVQNTKQSSDKSVEELALMHKEAVTMLKENNFEQVNSLKGRVMAYCEEEMAKMMASHEQMMQKCDEKMSEMKDGEDADEELIVEKVIARLEEMDSEEDDTEEEETPEEEAIGIRDSLELLQGDERLDISAIKGFEQTIEDIKNAKSVRIVGGGKTGLNTYVDGVKKGLIQYVDFVAGSNMTISPQLVNGLLTLTFASTGGSGFTTLNATETPDSSITTFTFAGATAQPSFLIVDNVWMRATTALGTVNWTWNNGTKKATLTIPAVDEILAVV